MEKRNSYYLIAIVALTIAVVSLSVGFAFTDIDLNISGDVTAKATKWSVKFNEVKNINKAVTTTVATPATIATGGLTASYTVTLTKPGDFYEFDIEVINDGDFDAKLKNIALTSTENIAYLNHTVTYNSTNYTAASNTVSGNTLAANGGTEIVHVKIEYVQPANESDLPAADAQSTYTVTLTYTQATA